MKTILAAAAAAAMLVGGAASAQQAGSHNPAVKNSDVHTTPSAKGANSFTKGQAMKRIQKAGYTGVTGLAKDANGVWQGTAMKDGKSVAVGLDYKGNVSVR